MGSINQTSRKSFIIAAVIIFIATITAYLLASNRPTAVRNAAPKQNLLQVDTVILQPQTYQFQLQSFGTPRPRTQSRLVAQVGGQIMAINPAFNDGGFFNRGDVLIQIDDRDYHSNVKIAHANLLQAELNLEQEKARSKQAIIDWQRLGNGAEAPALVERKPQLAAARAQVLSAQANLEKAQLDLDRSQIKAPFDGRVLTKLVDLGQFVNSGTPLAEIFATDIVEIRLPLKNSELQYIDLPENYRDTKHDPSTFPSVTITSELSGKQHWQGHIVRTEAAIDEQSYQLYVIAQIQEPFSSSNRYPLKIGQYVTADIVGRTLTDALIIPSKSLYQGSYVYVVRDGLLQRREVEIAFQTELDAVVRSGLQVGDELVVSPLGLVSSGTRVKVHPQSNHDLVDGTERAAQPDTEEGLQ